MRRALATLGLLAAFAGCGVDGEPIPPSDPDPARSPGVSISGTASIGVTGGSS
ncbi:argininosuccinate lyase [Aliiruegeria haliotis]|uniref:argininosuccinate lyase n=1 Tax=Aliiruegeria haliotis TaxID=1280846 RepID=UPI001FE40714|nr:argininosuccinate lyase [Aliiruegeria haliotis]